MANLNDESLLKQTVMKKNPSFMHNLQYLEDNQSMADQKHPTSLQTDTCYKMHAYNVILLFIRIFCKIKKQKSW